MDDNELFNPGPQLTAPPPAPVAPAPVAPAAPAPGGGDPAVWTVLGEAHPGDARGELAVASTFANRQRLGGYGSYADVVNDPANGYQAWQTPATRAQIQRQYPVDSPQYQAVSSMLDQLRAGKTQPLPYTYYHMTGMKNPPAWGAGPGDDIGGNTFYTLPYHGTAPTSGAPQLSDDEVNRQFNALGGGAGPTTTVPQPPTTGPSGAGGAFASLGNFNAGGPQGPVITAPQPSTPEGRQPAPKGDITWGPGFSKVTAAAYKTLSQLNGGKGPNANADAGSPALPYYAAPGTQFPQRPGDHWVDADGVHHVNPGGLLDKTGFAVAGALQGLGLDTAASASRLTGGGVAVDNPTYAALGQGLGGPSAFDIANAAQQGFRNQQANYAAATRGQPAAQAGRFVGQAIPATIAAGLVPEIEAPQAAGVVGRVAARGLQNALQGVAAATPSVGANPNESLGQQYGTAALTGVVASPALGFVGNKTADLVGAGGYGRTVSPEVAALANTAEQKYGLKLDSGQVMAANGDQASGVARSNMLASDPGLYARNTAQRQQWQRGVTNTYGDESGNIGHEALSANRARIGGVMNQVAQNVGRFDASDLPARLDEIVGQARQVDAGMADALSNLAGNIKATMAPDGTLSGEAYQALTRNQSPLQVSINKADTPYPAMIKDALDDTLQRSADPADVAAFRNARWQYKNLMTVGKAAQNQNNIGIDGVLKPNSLNTAVTSQFKDRAFSGAGDLDELNAIRNKFMTEPPNSFTPARAADLLAPFKAAASTGGLTALGLSAFHRPESLWGAGGAAASTLAGYGGKAIYEALKQSRIGGPAAGIIARSLPNAPGSALAGIGAGLKGGAKAVEVPLSALAGVRLSPFAPVGSPAGQAP